MGSRVAEAAIKGEKECLKVRIECWKRNPTLNF